MISSGIEWVLSENWKRIEKYRKDFFPDRTFPLGKCSKSVISAELSESWVTIEKYWKQVFRKDDLVSGKMVNTIGLVSSVIKWVLNEIKHHCQLLTDTKHVPWEMSWSPASPSRYSRNKFVFLGWPGSGYALLLWDAGSLTETTYFLVCPGTDEAPARGSPYYISSSVD
jgi:hypothetical protein